MKKWFTDVAIALSLQSAKQTQTSVVAEQEGQVLGFPSVSTRIASSGKSYWKIVYLKFSDRT